MFAKDDMTAALSRQSQFRPISMVVEKCAGPNWECSIWTFKMLRPKFSICSDLHAGIRHAVGS